MIKCVATKPFAVLEKLLIIEEDVLYVEKVRQMYNVYNGKTRKFLGKITEAKFDECLVKDSKFKIYDNTKGKNVLNSYLSSLLNNKNKTVHKDSVNVIKALINENF